MYVVVSRADTYVPVVGVELGMQIKRLLYKHLYLYQHHPVSYTHTHIPCAVHVLHIHTVFTCSHVPDPMHLLSLIGSGATCRWDVLCHH